MEAWQEREMWVGEKAFVSGPCGGLYVSMFVSNHVTRLPKSPWWLLTACGLHVAHEALRVCPTPRPRQAPHPLPVTLSPSSPVTPHKLPSYPVFLEPHTGASCHHPDQPPQKPDLGHRRLASLVCTCPGGT